MRASVVGFRGTELADVDAIHAIERSAFSDPWSVRSFRELVGRHDVVFEVAEADQSAGRGVIGFAIIYLADYEGDLANLAIASGERGHGTGRRLLRHVLDLARGRGAQVIFLEVRESNEAARVLYESEGFVEVGRRAKYYVRPVEDALILRKELV